MRIFLAISASLVVTAPASPKAPRFLPREPALRHAPSPFLPSPLPPPVKGVGILLERYSAPCAWQASSITIKLYFSAILAIGSMSAIWPYKWTGMMADTMLLVFLLMGLPVLSSLT